MRNKTSFKKAFKTIWVAIGVLFTAWMFYSYESHGVDNKLFQSNDFITAVDTDDFFSFTPKRAFRDVLIFFPGAMVDPQAYVPLCRKISENGLQVYLIKMPWRLASQGYTKPTELGIFNDTSKTYILSGHSQGAKMAAQFVYENPGLTDKLVLIGSTHPRDISLADTGIPVLKIYGSNDGVADEQSIIKNKSKLPVQTKFVKITGANHSQFGYYGFQLGDSPADISREQQLSKTVGAILAFINE